MLVAYTDGACSFNPGPAGLGVVFIHDDIEWELSEFLGEGTNNIAELTAVLRAVERAEGAPIRIHTDSTYAIGILQKGWRAKANQQLVGHIRDTLAANGSVELVHVRGHSGDPLNERADALAVRAVREQRTTPWAQVD